MRNFLVFFFIKIELNITESVLLKLIKSVNLTLGEFEAMPLEAAAVQIIEYRRQFTTAVKRNIPDSKSDIQKAIEPIKLMEQNKEKKLFTESADSVIDAIKAKDITQSFTMPFQKYLCDETSHIYQSYKSLENREFKSFIPPTYSNDPDDFLDFSGNLYYIYRLTSPNGLPRSIFG